MYPRFDTAVSRGLNHLLKSPFVVHPKTGRVCVPIDAQHAEQFDPLNVPTLPDLVAQVNQFDATTNAAANADAVEDALLEAASDNKSDHLHKTTLASHVKYFADAFLRPMQKSRAAALRAAKNANAASAIDF